MVMKNTLIAIALLFAATAQAQISASGGAMYLSDATIASYRNPDIYVAPAYNPFVEQWIVRCTVVDPAIDVQETIEFTVVLRKSDVDAYTGTGTETAALIDAVEQGVIDYLEAIAANSAITFSH